MRMLPGITSSPTRALTILSVSPDEEDHRRLQTIIGHSNWIFFKADSVPSAMAFLQEHEISVVLCEQNLQGETWIDVLENIKHLRRPPSLIVTSKLADE